MAERPPVRAVIAMLALAAPIALLGRGERPARHGADGQGAGRVRSGGGTAAAVPQHGDLALSGVVIDASGAPVAGVVVTARLYRPGPGTPIDTPDPSAWTASASSSADGRFTISGLPARRYLVDVRGAGIFAGELDGVPVPSDDVRIMVAREVALTGRVVDGGEPVAGATVEIAGDAIAGRRTATTGADGAFAFDPVPEGGYDLWAWQGALAARARRVPRLGGGPFPPIELALEPATIVVGRVVDQERGDGIAAAVELRQDGGSEAARYARSGADGLFRIEGVPHGRWTADAWAPGWVTAATVELEAGRGVPAVELVTGGVVEGRVVDEDGTPIAGASVHAEAVVRGRAGRGTGKGTGTGTGTGDGDRDGDGDGDGGGDGDAGGGGGGDGDGDGGGGGGGAGPTYSAAADAETLRRYSGLGPVALAPVAVTAAAPAAADPRFVPRGELGVLLGPIPFPPPLAARAARRATILDQTLHAGPAVLEADPLPIDPARAPSWTTDADGRFRVTGLPSGAVIVYASRAGFAESDSGAIATGPGAIRRNVTLALTRGAIVTGAITDQHGVPVDGATVAAIPRGGTRLDAVTDAAGTYRVGPITGTITLAVSAYAHADVRAAFELPATGEVRHDVVLAVDDAVLAGTVDDRAGAPVLGATVTVTSGPAAGRSATTGAAGFRIERLPPGALTVRIEHPEFPPAQRETTTTAPVHLALPFGGGIDGTVADHHTGAALAGIVVTATGPGGARAERATDATGAFALAPLAAGTWQLAIEHPGHLRIERPVEVPAGDRTGAITVRGVALEVERGALLAGLVRDRRGRVAGATVTVARTTGDGPILTVRTDADGEFRVRDVPSGALTLRATRGARTGTLSITAAPGDEQLALDVELR